MANIQNLNTYDPFNDNEQLKSGGENVIHIRVQQRNNRKMLTTVQGIAEKFDKKMILKVLKKEMNCNGTVVDHEEYGEVLQLQGDKRTPISEFLIKNQLTQKDQIRVHGF